MQDYIRKNRQGIENIPRKTFMFSDHHFVIAGLDFNPAKSIPLGNLGRQLSEKNLLKISKELDKLQF